MPSPSPPPPSPPSLLALPPELRHQIYKLAFGDENKVIIFMNDNRTSPNIRHCVCPAKGENYHELLFVSADNDTWCDCATHGRWKRHPVEDVTRRRVPLLLVCREIYEEAVDLLWSHNPVHMSVMGPEDFDIVQNVQAAIPPRQFRTIRSLEISFLHPAEGRYKQDLDKHWFTRWNSFWAGLKDMTGLIHLQAWIKMDHPELINEVTAKEERRLLVPLMEFRIPDFTVEVTWPVTGEENEGFLASAPFVLSRSDEGVSWSDESDGEVRVLYSDEGDEPE